MKKKGMAEAVLLLIIVVVGVVAAGVIMNKIDLGGLASVAPGDDLVCTSDVTPSVNLRAYDKENVGTANTEAGLYRGQGDVTWTAFTPGTAIDNLEVGRTYDYVYGISTTDFTDNAYGPTGEFTVECKELVTKDVAVAIDEIETSLTATWYDRNGVAQGQNFTSGQVWNVYAEFIAGSDEYFGNPYLPDTTPNVVCMDLSSTTWDTPVRVSVDGVEMNRVSQPTRHSSVSGDITYCYEAPVITDAGVEFKLRLDADDSNSPAADETLTIYAANWFVNSDTGELEYGVEDNNGAAVGTDAADTLTMDFTI